MATRTPRSFFRKAVLTTVALFGVAAAGQASAAVTNGGFENGILAGFNRYGSAAAVDNSYYSFVPQGNVQARLSTTAIGGAPAPVTSGVLESDLGLTLGTLNAQGNGQTSNGSAIQQTGITANGGDVFTFQANLLTNEGTLGKNVVNNDFAFITLTPVTSGVTVQPGGATGNAGVYKFAQATDALLPTSIQDQQNTGLANQTGYKTYSFVVPAGTYSLGFGVVDAGPAGGSTVLLVDNVQQNAGAGGVPLPAGVMVMPVVAGAALLVARRMRKTA